MQHSSWKKYIKKHFQAIIANGNELKNNATSNDRSKVKESSGLMESHKRNCTSIGTWGELNIE